MTRNPITDPRPGDVTRTPDGRVRVVYDVTPDHGRGSLIQWRTVGTDAEDDGASMPVNVWTLYNNGATVLYAADADPQPLPAPALGMRVWFTTRVETSSYTDSFDVRSGPPKEWGDALKGVEFTHIVDFRTGEVLWRRQ